MNVIGILAILVAYCLIAFVSLTPFMLSGKFSKMEEEQVVKNEQAERETR